MERSGECNFAIYDQTVTEPTFIIPQHGELSLAEGDYCVYISVSTTTSIKFCSDIDVFYTMSIEGGKTSYSIINLKKNTHFYITSPTYLYINIVGKRLTNAALNESLQSDLSYQIVYVCCIKGCDFIYTLDKAYILKIEKGTCIFVLPILSKIHTSDNYKYRSIIIPKYMVFDDYDYIPMKKSLYPTCKINIGSNSAPIESIFTKELNIEYEGEVKSSALETLEHVRLKKDGGIIPLIIKSILELKK